MRLAAAALAMLWLASACGASAHTRAGSSAADTLRSSPPASAGCPSAPRSLCVTVAARGHTVTLPLGWKLTLVLDAPGRSFGIPAQQGAALRQLGPAKRSGGAVTVAYRGVRVGSVQLRAPERPRCRAGVACPQFVVLWTLTVRVSRRPSPAG